MGQGQSEKSECTVLDIQGLYYNATALGGEAYLGPTYMRTEIWLTCQ